MNTKASVGIGWAAYTAAFAAGGGIGYYQYWYRPGGRYDREKAAQAADDARTREELAYERRVREERAARADVPPAGAGGGGPRPSVPPA